MGLGPSGELGVVEISQPKCAVDSDMGDLGSTEGAEYVAQHDACSYEQSLRNRRQGVEWDGVARVGLADSEPGLVALEETVAHIPEMHVGATELQVYSCVRVRSCAPRVAADEAQAFRRRHHKAGVEHGHAVVGVGGRVEDPRGSGRAVCVASAYAWLARCP